MLLNINANVIWTAVDLLILFLLMKKFLFGWVTAVPCWHRPTAKSLVCRFWRLLRSRSSAWTWTTSSQSIGLREKHAVLDRLPELREQSVLRNFYKLLVNKKRFSILPEIADAYTTFCCTSRGRACAHFR